MEFSFKTEVVRHRVNALLGPEAITKITLDTGPSANGRSSVALDTLQPPPELPTSLKTKVDALENSDLREALEGLGRWMLSGRSQRRL